MPYVVEEVSLLVLTYELRLNRLLVEQAYFAITLFHVHLCHPKTSQSKINVTSETAQSASVLGALCLELKVGAENTHNL